MISPSLLCDPLDGERRRLSALHATRLLDTGPEEMFDCLTRTACDALSMPMALVSLVDKERQWFKSRCGLDVAETPRSSSFCAHAISAQDVMVVPDALADPRFADNPLVTGEPHIRFYAGVPLYGPEGQAIGSFCVLDRAPRVLTDAQLRVLKNLAATAQELIQSRQIALVASALCYSNGDPHMEGLAGDLVRLLARDPLTGLPPRAELETRIQQSIPAWRDADVLATVAIVDVDNFGGINSALTYHNGDQVLVELANRLRAAVGATDAIARIGGDAFVVLLCEDGNGDDMATRLERLWQTAQFSLPSQARQLDVTCGIGFARFPADGENADALINAARMALQNAKQAGRGTLLPYYPRAQAANDYLLENDLGRAIQNNELELHYQPKVDLTSGRIVGVEALARWRHPTRGMVGPAEFIPLAEQTGRIVGLSAWIIDKACAELAHWRAHGIQDVSMAVNLSSRLFSAVGLVQMIGDSIERHGLPGNAIDLEVTESGSMADPALAIRLMKQLKRLGVTISVDDFGTGYSSLSYLKDFPIDAIKIDRSFVVDVLTSEGTLAIMQGMIATARRLGLQIVAEGVETVEQRDLLLREQCDIVQGYLYSRPLPGASCLALLETDQSPATCRWSEIA